MNLGDLAVRLENLGRAYDAGSRSAAEAIAAKLRSDATTRRGNVPQFAPGPRGTPMTNIPIVAVPVPGAIKVTAAEWVLDKAREKGQPAEWSDIAAAEMRKALGGAL